MRRKIAKRGMKTNGDRDGKKKSVKEGERL